MKKIYIEESGYYKIRKEVLAENEEEAIDILYSYSPSFIEVESNDSEVEEIEWVLNEI